jgi:hypothetical protein
MARTIEQVIQEQLGAMAFQVAALTAQLEKVSEALTPEQLAALKAKSVVDMRNGE